MRKKVKSQPSSSRAVAAGFGGFGGFSSAFSSQGRSPSALPYVAEPPNLSRILEPQLVVAFKNVLKKDEITRAKALDDLKEHVTGAENQREALDSGFLEAWVCQSEGVRASSHFNDLGFSVAGQNISTGLD